MNVSPNIAEILGLNNSPPRETSRNRKGVMVYSHKTGGEIQISTADEYERNKAYYVPNGARSAVKNFSKNISI